MQTAFQSLSFEVMDRSTKNFLDLARAAFEKAHEGAKADLELKQKSFESLVAPLARDDEVARRASARAGKAARGCVCLAPSADRGDIQDRDRAAQRNARAVNGLALASEPWRLGAGSFAARRGIGRAAEPL